MPFFPLLIHRNYLINKTQTLHLHSPSASLSVIIPLEVDNCYTKTIDNFWNLTPPVKSAEPWFVIRSRDFN